MTTSSFVYEGTAKFCVEGEAPRRRAYRTTHRDCMIGWCRNMHRLGADSIAVSNGERTWVFMWNQWLPVETTAKQATYADGGDNAITGSGQIRPQAF